MNENEQFKKKETVNDDKPGVNGNFDSLIPGIEESIEAEKKCIGAYKALMRAKGFTIEEKPNEKKEGLDNGGKQEPKE